MPWFWQPPPDAPSQDAQLAALRDDIADLTRGITKLTQEIRTMSASIAQELNDIRTGLGSLSSDLDAIKTRLDSLPAAGDSLTPASQALLDGVRDDVTAAVAKADTMAGSPPAP